jgi:hyperosmotically inducible protein
MIYNALQRILFVLTCFVILTAAHANPSLKHIEQDISDSVITTKIAAKFTKNLQINPFKITVSTEKGIVILKGTVKDKKAYLEALRITKNTRGVKGIDIEALMIKQVNTALTDAYITAKVEAAILKAKVFDDESIPLVGINATTNNGHVTLTGRVKNANSVSYIIKRVAGVKGVKKIISQLVVHPS